jgi:formate/nitrite transporter FocA (FNT family)
VSAASPILQSDLRALWIKEGKLSDWLRYVVPAVAGLFLVAAAVWLAVDPGAALYVIALVIIVYVVVGTQNAWNVLLAGRFDVGAWSVKRTRDKDADGR